MNKRKREDEEGEEDETPSSSISRLDTFNNPYCCENKNGKKENEMCECPVCMESKQLHELLPCHHYVCLSCINGIIDNTPNDPQCPNCRTKIDKYGCNGNYTNVPKSTRISPIINFLTTYILENDVDEYDFEFEQANFIENVDEYFRTIISELNSTISISESVENDLLNVIDEHISELEDIYENNENIRIFNDLKYKIINEVSDVLQSDDSIGPRQRIKILATFYVNLNNLYSSVSRNNARNGGNKRRTNKRRTNKRRTNKRRTNKRRTNKRRKNKRRKNKRRTNRYKKYNHY